MINICGSSQSAERGVVMQAQLSSSELRLVAPDVYWQQAWELARHRYPRPPAPTDAAGEASIRRELLFCLLGGHGVPYELNLSATEVLWRRGLFRHWRPTAVRLDFELSARQFTPLRKDGSMRRYRYPKRKAQALSEAARWMAEHGPLFSALLGLDSERERRSFLCACPGIGLKSASWLLRNCGLAGNLAILDVHVLRAMRESGRAHSWAMSDYEGLEQVFLAWCEDLGTEPAGFDLMLWEWSRSSAG
jgi:N-glycosylase/DNA lyase